MKYVKQEITDYTSTNITQLHPDWVAGTTYALGDIIKYGSYFYKSAIASNVGQSPEEYLGVYWITWGVSNKHSMIDLQSSTQTVVTGDDLIVTFPIGDIDTLAIGYYSATTLIVENLDASNNVLYTQTFTQSVNNTVTDYYSYMYDAYSIEVDKAQYIDIHNLGTQLRVSFMRGVLTEVSCGFLIGGQAIDMGKTLDSVQFKFTSYSTKKPDEYGIITITKRSVQDLVDFQTAIDKAELTQLKRYAKRDYDDIVAFIVDDTEDSVYENLITLGVIQNMSTVATNQTKQFMTWSILEAI